MITIGDQNYSLSDPTVLMAILGIAAGILVLLLLISAVRRAGRTADVVAPLAEQISRLGQSVEGLGQGQERLKGGLDTVSDTQANAQAKVLHTMETRLGEVQRDEVCTHNFRPQ